MFTTSTGWAQQKLSDDVVLHTTEGVERWSVATPPLPPGQNIVAAAYVSADDARVLSAGGLSSNYDATPVTMTFTSWATDDGGALWVRGGSFSVKQDPGLSWGSDLDYVSPADGWFSANEDDTDVTPGTTLFRTLDGGASWQVVARLLPSPNPADLGGCFVEPTVAFISPATGWLTGGCEAAEFEVTHDGGATWTAQAIPGLDTPYLGLADPIFISSQEGVMVGTPTGGGGPVRVYVTSDGGWSWTEHFAPGEWPHAVDFISADDGWLLSTDTMNAGYPAGLYATKDGGQTWSTLQALDHAAGGPLPVEGTVLNGSILDFVSPTLGWTDNFTGDGDTLLQTTDGGHTWSAVTVQITGSSG